jgi:hypothetical protein
LGDQKLRRGIYGGKSVWIGLASPSKLLRSFQAGKERSLKISKLMNIPVAWKDLATTRKPEPPHAFRVMLAAATFRKLFSHCEAESVFLYNCLLAPLPLYSASK